MGLDGSVQKQLNSFLKDKGVVSKGRVYLLDLSPLRERLGSRWEKLQGKVLSTVNGVINLRLQAIDISYSVDDVTFLIAFGALDESRAKIKVNLIAQEITQRLLGSAEQDRAVHVNMATTSPDGRLIWDDEVDPSEHVVHEEKVKPSANQHPMQKMGFVNGDVNFIFRPLWFVKNKIISAYFCIPVRDLGDGRFASGYDVLNDPTDPQAIEALDVLVMQRVRQEAENLAKSKSSALLAMPLHFETLAAKGRMAQLIEKSKANLEPHRGKIVVELTNLPEGIPQFRLQELVQLMKPFSRSVMARFDLKHREFQDYKSIGLHAVGVDLYGDTREEDKIVKDVEEFAARASEQDLHCYAHGLRSISLSTFCICAGFEYIDGYAITNVNEGAKDVQFYNLRTPYDQKYDELVGDAP